MEPTLPVEQTTAESSGSNWWDNWDEVSNQTSRIKKNLLGYLLREYVELF